ncbi:MAG: WGR domain-containing protein [Verrucomicrobiota bacterium]
MKAFGWRFALVLTKDWYHMPDDVLTRIEKLLQGQEAEVEPEEEEASAETLALPAAPPTTTPAPPQPIQTETNRTDATPVPPVAPAIAPPGTTRRFEFVGGPSQKFWEISVSGISFTVRFGRIGTAGQSQTKNFPDEAKTKREAENLIAEKVKKGYAEIIK